MKKPETLRYAMIGASVFLLAILTVFAGLWLMTSRGRLNYQTYVTYMDEGVFGLNEESVVRFNGVPVGYVQKISLDPSSIQRVRILLRLRQDILVSTQTVAELKSQGITGLTYIELSMIGSDGVQLIAKRGETYPEIPSQHSFIVELGDTLKRVSSNLEAVGTKMNTLFSDNNIQTFSKVLGDVNQLTTVLAAGRDDLGHSMTNLHIVTENTAQQTLPQLQTLLTHLNEVAIRLQQVSTELEQNPSILIRGKQPSLLGPGEK